MFISHYETKRENRKCTVMTDLVVVGGGMTGVCCAIAAARGGIKVALVQDRPVLGGNASSEVRLWILGATSHMGNNNRWSREGGIIDEILVENMFRNREGNPVLFDMVLLDKVLAENNISLFLNTFVYGVDKKDDRNIASVTGFNPQEATEYKFEAPLFADCSGDGIVAFNAGAGFRMGAESRDEFEEGFAPDKDEYGELLGNSIFFYTKDTGRPVDFTAPDFALKNVEELIPRVKNPSYLNPAQHGCKYWWLEYGGRLDTIYDAERIKYELLKVVYGIWDYLKNSGRFPQTRNQTLEWAGVIPGKRESRRFDGYYMLTQNDVIGQNTHYDAVSYGGWSIDLHPADGVYSPNNGCNQWHSKGVYQIPYRCYVSRDLDNLLLGGRIISTSHVANGSSRVMCTCAHGGQAIGTAAALCTANGLLPADYIDSERIGELQLELLRIGHHIPLVDIREDIRNLASSAEILASSTFIPAEIPFSDFFEKLDYSIAQLFPTPLGKGRVTVRMKAQRDTEVEFSIRTSLEPYNFTPETVKETHTISLKKGLQDVDIPIAGGYADGEYLFMTFKKNPDAAICMSEMYVTGIGCVYNIVNEAVSNYGKQTPPDGIGIDTFEFWIPKRRPDSRLIGMKLDNPPAPFGIGNLRNSYYRPVMGPNAWVAAADDEMPTLTLKWDAPHELSLLRLFLDTDFDNAMENVQLGHCSPVTPGCVADIAVRDGGGNLLAEKRSNYQTVVDLNLGGGLNDTIVIELKKPSANVPAALFGLIIW